MKEKKRGKTGLCKDGSNLAFSSSFSMNEIEARWFVFLPFRCALSFLLEGSGELKTLSLDIFHSFFICGREEKATEGKSSFHTLDGREKSKHSFSELLLFSLSFDRRSRKLCHTSR